MSSWVRLVDYARTWIKTAVRSGDKELDELEAELAQKQAAEPWLADDAPAPSFEQAQARIERRAEQTGVDQDDAAATAVRDHAADERAAAERLARIRESLVKDDDQTPPKA